MGSHCSNCSQCQKDRLDQINEVTITKKSESNKAVIVSQKVEYQCAEKQAQKQILQTKMAIMIQKQWKGYKVRKAYLQTKLLFNKSQNDQVTTDKKSKRGKQKYFTKEEYELTIKSESLQREYRSKYKFISGSTYEGEWLGDKRDEQGIQIWEDGAKYIGQWKNNQAFGQGTFYHVDGDVYEGEWQNDKANGF
ncbi:unnamed protein product (macronuclear) [Paramecium tetraurelia]|uniref:MORN repeat protein n=1 Tax=Paramecium tetraurelia TaxID=5888 RepID=A0CKA7_PARTE|nr:uncharacterized protein GSPATT00000937001 [Paramecium tetraurelia]CAK71224.1 unnamed protein product [Paramecium tetraurelia]|eukprot:XP_001438621.1 hypothetical protein (macronuclear) [Paramecium tetraurelia strain d4-2]